MIGFGSAVGGRSADQPDSDAGDAVAGRRYSDAVNDALQRLTDCGFEWGPGFAFHAPMAAEALAVLGYGEDVGDWVEWNRTHRSYLEPPEPRWRIDPDQSADWLAARGDFARVADWAQLFARELDSRGWPEVLAQWWPRLLPGMFGALSHGLIRTAHAIRGVALVPAPTPTQLWELAQGLGYFAARYREPPPVAVGGAIAADLPETAPDDADTALRDLAATMAGYFADRAPLPAVPLVHTITAPAAVHLVLPVLPTRWHDMSYQHARRAVFAMVDMFSRTLRPEALVPDGTAPTLDSIVAAAVETRDEHAIKLAEACARLHVNQPDERYPRAAATLLRRF